MVLCYPSHSTHLYQGLDVVIFSVLKRAWSKFRDDYERQTKQAVNKTNFLSVYAKVHIETFTEANIRSAFRATGVVPFDPSVITENMLAPSRTTSTIAGLPIPLPAPIQILSDMIHCSLARQTRDHDQQRLEPDINNTGPVSDSETDAAEQEDNDQAVGMQVRVSSPVRMAISELQSTSARTIFSSSPIHSSDDIPHYEPDTISPFKKWNTHLLDHQPHTEMEKALQIALAEAEERDLRRKHAMITMQAATLLQNTYVVQVNGQLNAHEDKVSKKNKKKKKLTGRAQLLTGDSFFNMVVEAEENAMRAAQEKEERRGRREEHAVAISTWKNSKEKRKERNEEVRRRYHVDVKDWETERDRAKAVRQRPAWTKAWAYQGSRLGLQLLEA